MRAIPEYLRYERLSKKGQRAYFLMKWAQEQGISKTKFYFMIKGTPLGYRKADVLKDWDILAGKVKRARTLMHVRKDRAVSEKHYKITPVWLETEFETMMRVRFIDKHTGRIITRNVWVAHDRLMSPSELLDRAITRLNRKITLRTPALQRGEIIGDYAVDAMRRWKK